MISRNLKRLRLGFGLATAAALMAPAAAAQIQPGSPGAGSPGDALTSNLKALADEPRSVSALTGAATAALQLGDPQAALTFFARAEEIAPQDGRIKAGMGAAFVQLEQPQAAMRLFNEAAGLGVPPAEFAADRGLAYDLLGDSRRAQADYNLALGRRESDEVRRRLALSLAISGDRERALQVIDPLLRRQDRAAWRTDAFILALTGDEAGATRVAQSIVPGEADQLRPFFARLPRLAPADRALAVNFGHFPGAGSSQSSASPTQYASAPPLPHAVTEAGRPDSSQRPFGSPSTTNPAATVPQATQRVASNRRERVRLQPVTDSRDTARQQARTDYRPQSWTSSTLSVPATVAATPPRQSAPVQVAEATSVRDGGGEHPVSLLPSPLQTSQPARTSAQPTTTARRPVQGPPDIVGATRIPPRVAVSSSAAAAPTTAPVASGVTQGAAPSLLPSTTSTSTASVSAPTSSAVQTATPAQQIVAQNAPTLQPVQLPPSAPAQEPASSLAGARFADVAAAVEALPAEPDPVPARASTPPVHETVSAAPEHKASTRSTKAKSAAAAAGQEDDAATAASAKKGATAKPSLSKEQAGKKGTAKPAGSKSASLKDDEENGDTPGKKGAKDKKSETAATKQTSRVWVQIAGGADKAAMTREFDRLKGKAPKLLASRTPWTTPLRATNRLLVGPFKSNKEAQDFVNELAKLDLSAFSWTSPAGQEIVKLSSK